MAQNITFVAVFVCLISVSWATIIKGPENDAVLVGTTVELRCEATVTQNERIQFLEFITNPNGAAISDGNFLLPGHPNAERYELVTDANAGWYLLTIRGAILEDGGRYACRDINAIPSAMTVYSELVMIEANPNCTTTLPGNRIVNLDQYYTAECLIAYQSSLGVNPLMLWSGSGNFAQASTSTSTSTWSGMSFNAERVMDGKAFICTTNFTTEGFDGENSASNVPTWSYTFSTGLLFVQFVPMDLYYQPVQESYEIGQVLTCYSEAVPLPTYRWTNMVTGNTVNSQSLVLLQSDVGQNYLRCQAINAVGSADLFVNITVNPITTPTTPTTTTPAPTVPAAAPCDDLTGRWEYTRENGHTTVLCANVDQTRNGLLGGLYWNDTRETYFLEVIGRTKLDDYQEVGFTTIWATDIGVSSFAGECHKCHGEEVLLLNALSRPSSDDGFCINGGSGIIESPLLLFKRKPITFPCSSTTSQMHKTAYDSRAHLPAKRRRRMADPAPRRA